MHLPFHFLVIVILLHHHRKVTDNGIGNLDISKKKGKYRSNKKLQHWWFFDTTAIANVGVDRGTSRLIEPSNILAEGVGITEVDLVVDAPGY